MCFPVAQVRGLEFSVGIGTAWDERRGLKARRYSAVWCERQTEHRDAHDGEIDSMQLSHGQRAAVKHGVLLAQMMSARMKSARMKSARIEHSDDSARATCKQAPRARDCILRIRSK
jgi:hypothetical protein